jgi:acetyl esterase/lipase
MRPTATAWCAATALAATLGACGGTRSNMITFDEIAAEHAAPADHRIAYGDGPLHFGELRLPEGSGAAPVVVLIHGGCWQNAYDLAHNAPAAEALARAGFAVWTVEYRRLGDEGGGWPGTFADVAAAVDHVRALAGRFPRLDTARVVLMGHSAGGHLALWAASRHPGDDPGGPDPLRPAGVVSLAGITDLRAYAQGTGDCNASVHPLLGGPPSGVPGRYAAASPVERVPLGVAVRLVHGDRDPIVPLAQPRALLERMRAAGEDAALAVVEGTGHFDVIAPRSRAWPAVVDAARALARDGA